MQILKKINSETLIRLMKLEDLGKKRFTFGYIKIHKIPRFLGNTILFCNPSVSEYF